MEKSGQICTSNRSLGGPKNLRYSRCGGSLPIKKRRIMANGFVIPVFKAKNDSPKITVNSSSGDNLTPSIQPSISEVAAATTMVSNFSKPSSGWCNEFESNPSLTINNRDDEKIAALALISARTSSQSKSERITLSQNCIPLGKLTQSQNLKSKMPGRSVINEPNNANTPRQRVYHPPLTQPLPNGCHGRTSRNNSYCRRYPRYNGSLYCKLHYQQYVLNNNNNRHIISDSSVEKNPTLTTVQGSNQSNDTTPTNITASELEAAKAMARQIALTCTSTDSFINMYQLSGRQYFPVTNTKSNTISNKNASYHQDKKFSNLPGEAQCKATTTRGRSCAYVSVNDTLYCHLHSEYGTNPPAPRRGSGSNQNQNSEKKNNSASQKKDSKLFLVTKKDVQNENPPNNDTNEKDSKAVLSVDNISSHMKKNANTNTITTKLEAEPPSESLPKNSENTEKINSIHKNESIILNQLKCLKNALMMESTKGSSQILSCVNLQSNFKCETGQIKVPSSSGNYMNNIGNKMDSLQLLTSVNSLQWENKLVRIMFGPLARHTGRIMRWGNGWVTIGTYAGLHNRRAFELQLLPDVIESRKDYDLADEPDEAQWPNIQTIDGSNKNDIKRPSEITKLSNDKSIGLVVVNSNDNVVCADRIGSSIKNIVRDGEDQLSAKAKPQNLSEESAKPSSLGTLVPCKSEGSASQPVAHELDHRFDLLYGTAACDRTRRKIKEPEWYDDKSMIERKRGSSDLSAPSSPKVNSTKLEDHETTKGNGNVSLYC